MRSKRAFEFCGDWSIAIAGKPAPTSIHATPEINCGSGLARDEASKITSILSD
jgi:hypothetical protein